MSTFLLCAAALVLGYFAYGSLLDRLVRPDAFRPTPALSMADAVDYVPMSTPRLFLIQLLNIAGLGPVFGAILGALYGPLALVWIVVGCLFAGGVHDYLSGMLSLRAGGESLPDVVGRHLGGGFKHLIRVFSLLLMVLVGVVFVLGPAKLLAKLSGLDAGLWVGLIFAYYFLATILPFDKIIGRLYPFFGALLLFMAAAMPIALLGRGYQVLPELALSNLHPDGLPVWPLLFTTVACGAISGFHSTQSPMVARCMKNERDGRLIFYGAMVAEGLIALVWATVGMSFYPGPEALGAALAAGGPAVVVSEACTTLLGPLGGVLAILGVVVLPVSTGDTAFRAARLIVADFCHAPQRELSKRLFIAVPLFLAGIALSGGSFELLWRYMGWANQSLATVVLWTISASLARRGNAHWIATAPALFMTAMTSAYILNAPIGFNLPMDMATGLGICASGVALAFFLRARRGEAASAAAPDRA